MSGRTKPEEGFQDGVVEYAHLRGWRAAHFRPAWSARGYRTPVQYDGDGFPDLVLCRSPRLVIAEVKVRAPVSAKQRAWLDLLGEVPGIEVYVWRPKDWPEIERVLA